MIEWIDDRTNFHQESISASDIRSIKGDGEYLIFKDQNGNERQLRLDKLLSFITIA